MKLFVWNPGCFCLAETVEQARQLVVSKFGTYGRIREIIAPEPQMFDGARAFGVVAVTRETEKRTSSLV